jgi:toxin-antitoxin system PIN domain toxin
VIAVDTNILVYAHRPESPFHERARTVVRTLAEGSSPWAIPVHCLVEFAGVVGHPRIFRVPSSPSQIRAQIEAWRQSSSLRLLVEDVAFVGGFLDALETSRAQGGGVHDARIAALCRFHDVRVLYSADRDFSRYAWLATRNPLVDE